MNIQVLNSLNEIIDRLDLNNKIYFGTRYVVFPVHKSQLPISVLLEDGNISEVKLSLPEKIVDITKEFLHFLKENNVCLYLPKNKTIKLRGRCSLSFQNINQITSVSFFDFDVIGEHVDSVSTRLNLMQVWGLPIVMYRLIPHNKAKKILENMIPTIIGQPFSGIVFLNDYQPIFELISHTNFYLPIN